ncbi:MAG: biotin--[acetyl-CoA-carboxylase] ligase [Ilumatobacteraceae bacterium]|nr:biotin--[acetyl-CoA-carboxylase] ligase [Ilumatobacteraceae bacterium]
MDTRAANQSAKWLIQRVPQTRSTNADLLEQAQSGAAHGTVLQADFQTAGRGRLGRDWQAPSGTNLLVSLLFRVVPPHIHALTQMVALAASQAAARTTGVQSELKWPNDLLVGNKKLAGVLAQAGGQVANAVPDYVVVGIGVNVAWAPQDATSLRECGWTTQITPHHLLLEMLTELDSLLALSSDQQHSKYKQALKTIGQQVRVDMPGGSEIIGQAVDVEADGRLVVLDDLEVFHRIDTADVVHLRPA